MASILVIAAHPDDEILGGGGAITRHIDEGDSVTVLILGEGYAARDVSKKELKTGQEQLEVCAKKALAVLGAPAPLRRALPDNAFDTVPLLSVVKEIEKVIADTKPEIIYTHDAGDVNVDHRIVSQATEAAVRPMEGSSIREVRAFEVPSSSEWNFTRPAFRPNVFVALSEEQLKKKIAAMNAYTSEVRGFPHPRSPEYLEALARVRGGQSGSTAAEGFSLLYRRI